MKRNKKRLTSMPQQKNVDRFYYPINDRPVSLDGKTKKDLSPDDAKDAFLSVNADPNGSYTGVPADGGFPIQDADDL